MRFLLFLCRRPLECMYTVACGPAGAVSDVNDPDSVAALYVVGDMGTAFITFPPSLSERHFRCLRNSVRTKSFFVSADDDIRQKGHFLANILAEMPNINC